jgi:hypothetical protein
MTEAANIADRYIALWPDRQARWLWRSVRFSWSLGPGDCVDAPIEGTDFAVIENGLIKAITGFLDKVPTA